MLRGEQYEWGGGQGDREIIVRLRDETDMER